MHHAFLHLRPLYPMALAVSVLAPPGCGGGNAPDADMLAREPESRRLALAAAAGEFTLGGGISGLVASGLVLANGTDRLPVAADATTFVLPTSVPTGDKFNVVVKSQPQGLHCTVVSGNGTMGLADVDSIAVTCSDQAFTLGGSVSGLTAPGLVLVNGSVNLAVPAQATDFVLPRSLAFGSGYNVRIKAQPAGLVCSVFNGIGTIQGEVRNVALTCSDRAFRVSGAIDGLGTGGLVLANGGITVDVAAGATRYALPKPVASGGRYNVTVKTQPAGLTCTVSNGLGTMGLADVDNADVRCDAKALTLGGSVSGLGGSGLELVNGSVKLAVAAQATRFTLPRTLSPGSAYNLQVKAQPPGLTCSVARGTGTMDRANVDNVVVSCSDQAFTLGGSIVGLAGSGLELSNGGARVTVPSLATAFSLPRLVAAGSSFDVAVSAQPGGQHCAVVNGSGEMGGTAASTPTVRCSNLAHTVGGVVRGLGAGTGLVLANGSDTLVISPEQPAFRFTMPTALAFGSTYDIRVAAQPAGMTCSVADGRGRMRVGDVRDVAVTCSASAFTLGGTIGGLTTAGLVLASGGDTRAVAVGANSFTLPTAVASGSVYDVTVLAQPAGLHCSVAMGRGTMGTAAVSDIAVACSSRTVTVGGSIGGLDRGGLVLGSGGDRLAVAANAVAFSLPAAVAEGGRYEVTVLAQPEGLTCRVDSGSGTVAAADVGTIAVACTPAGLTVDTFVGTGAKGNTDAVGTAASFGDLTDVAIDRSGTLYLADASNHKIRRVAADGTVGTLAGSVRGDVDDVGSAAKFNNPGHVAVDRATGVLYVADRGNHRVRRITPDGTVSTLAGSGVEGDIDGAGTEASFGLLSGIAVGSDGTVYVADDSNHRIRRIAADGTVSTFAGSVPGHEDGAADQARFRQPAGLAFDIHGNLYVADAGNHRIRKITPEGVVSTLAGSGSRSGAIDGIGTTATFDFPRGLAVDERGHVFVADLRNNKLRQVSPDGTVGTVAGSGAVGASDGPAAEATFREVAGLAIGRDGEVYVTDVSNFKLRRLRRD